MAVVVFFASRLGGVDNPLDIHQSVPEPKAIPKATIAKQSISSTNLSGTTVTDKHELESGSLLLSHLCDVKFVPMKN